MAEQLNAWNSCCKPSKHISMSHSSSSSTSPHQHSLKFHPFYTITNAPSFQHLYANFRAILTLQQQQDSGISTHPQQQQQNAICFLSYLQVLQYRYRCHMPHILSCMYYFLINTSWEMGLMMPSSSLATRSPDGNITSESGDSAAAPRRNRIIMPAAAAATLAPAPPSGIMELCLSSSIQRFISGLSELRHQNFASSAASASSSTNTSAPSLSIKALLHSIGIPEYIISLRNRISHDVMPSYGLLKRATRDSLVWIHSNWWKRLQRSLEENDIHCHRQFTRYINGELLFEDLREEERWLMARIIVEKEIMSQQEGKLYPGDEGIQRLLKDDAATNSDASLVTTATTTHETAAKGKATQLQLSAAILSELCHFIFSQTLARAQIEHILKWFKHLVDQHLDLVWARQLYQHLEWKQQSSSQLSTTQEKICDMMLAMLKKKFTTEKLLGGMGNKASFQPTADRAKKRRKISHEGLYVDTGESADNHHSHIPQWELVEEEFDLPVGHVLPYAAHSEYTFEHFQLKDEDIEKQFIQLS